MLLPDVKVTVHFEEHKMRVQGWIHSSTITYPELLAKIENEKELGPVSDNFSDTSLQYKDDSGDLVTIQSNSDLGVALSKSRPTNYGFNEIDLFVTTNHDRLEGD